MLKVAEDLFFFFLFAVERRRIPMQVSPVCQGSCELTLVLTSISKMSEFTQGALHSIYNMWSMAAFFVYMLSVSGKNSLFDEACRLIVGNDLVSTEAFPQT